MPSARHGLMLLSMLALPLLASRPAGAVSDARAHVADTIRRDVAQMIAGINAHDPARATSLDAPDIVSMESGRPPSVGAAADRQGLTMAFQYSPAWHVRLIDETVDVANSGDMAVYRGTYWQDSTANGVPMTQKVNFIAGFRKQPDNSWQIIWSVVCNQERPHPV
jgi:ketosteroid isomerase-like protein